jgi:hypothetical protein
MITGILSPWLEREEHITKYVNTKIKMQEVPVLDFEGRNYWGQ